MGLFGRRNDKVKTPSQRKGIATRKQFLQTCLRDFNNVREEINRKKKNSSDKNAMSEISKSWNQLILLVKQRGDYLKPGDQETLKEIQNNLEEERDRRNLEDLHPVYIPQELKKRQDILAYAMRQFDEMLEEEKEKAV